MKTYVLKVNAPIDEKIFSPAVKVAGKSRDIHILGNFNYWYFKHPCFFQCRDAT